MDIFDTFNQKSKVSCQVLLLTLLRSFYTGFKSRCSRMHLELDLVVDRSLTIIGDFPLHWRNFFGRDCHPWKFPMINGTGLDRSFHFHESELIFPSRHGKFFCPPPLPPIISSHIDWDPPPLRNSYLGILCTAEDTKDVEQKCSCRVRPFRNEV